jgi:hypothetical protein
LLQNFHTESLRPRLILWCSRSNEKGTGAARELSRYILDLVDVQEVRWSKEDTVRAGDYNICYKEKEMKIIWEEGFLCTPENSIGS